MRKVQGSQGGIGLLSAGLVGLMLISPSWSATAPPKTPPPPKTWKEHWFEHEQVVKLVDFDDQVAIYFDDGVKVEDTNWIKPFMSRAWRYTKATYGPFGDPKGRLFAIFHQGRYGGGHPSTFFDASHEYRNVTDCGTGSWDQTSVDLPSHELGHIVEGANNGVHESPGFDLWHDSKWIELYQFDLYVGLGMKGEAQRVFDKFSNQTDDFPKANTHWFRDFFYPAWRDHGKSKLMANFFRLLAANFPQVPENNHPKYARKLNWGEFIHFMSAAAGRDLRPLARKAFDWPADREAQFQTARVEFPALTYRP